MRYLCAMIAAAIVLSTTAGLAATAEKIQPQPYFTLKVRDCSMPLCEEQVIYLRADDMLLFVNTDDKDKQFPSLGASTWQQAKTGAFRKVSHLARALAQALPPNAKCDKVGRERLRASGSLVAGLEHVQFQFSDACANQTSDSMPYQLVREIRDAMSLGVQPLLKG